MLRALKEKLFGQRSSKSLAKSRLHFVLVQDRTGLNNDELSGFKEEMVSVIEKYFVIDKTGFDISYKRNGDTTTLFINSPIIVKRQETINNDVGARKHGGHRKHEGPARTPKGAHAAEAATQDDEVESSGSSAANADR